MSTAQIAAHVNKTVIGVGVMLKSLSKKRLVGRNIVHDGSTWTISEAGEDVLDNLPKAPGVNW